MVQKNFLEIPYSTCLAGQKVKYVLSVSPFSKNISYNSSSHTGAIKGPEIILAKIECSCEAKP